MRKLYHKFMLILWAVAVAGVACGVVASVLSIVQPASERGFYIMAISSAAVGTVMMRVHYNEVFADA